MLVVQDRLVDAPPLSGPALELNKEIFFRTVMLLQLGHLSSSMAAAPMRSSSNG